MVRHIGNPPVCLFFEKIIAGFVTRCRNLRLIDKESRKTAATEPISLLRPHRASRLTSIRYAGISALRHIGVESTIKKQVEQSVLTSTFIRWRNTLRRVASGIVGNDDDAEDVIHEAFCKLWEKRVEVENETSAFRLSYTAVRNSAIDAVRRSKVRPTIGLDSLPETSGQDSGSEETMDTYNTVLAISRQALNERQYEIFRMHDIEGISYEEIAEELGMSQDNIRVILSRARKAIREIYRKRNGGIL